MRLKFLFLLILTFLTHFSFAGNFNFRHYATGDGLSQNTVYCILQDKWGFMWFGTKDGLNRFDGHDFKVFHYDFKLKNCVCSNYICSLYEDHDGYIWIGTNNGVCYYDPVNEIFTKLNDHTFLYAGDICDIKEDSQNNIWIQSFIGLYKYSKNDKTLQYYPTESHFVPVHICIRDSGDAWFAALDGCLYKYNQQKDSFTKYQILTQEEKDAFASISALTDAGKYGFLIGVQKVGLKRFDSDTGEIEEISLSKNPSEKIHIRTILQYTDREYWIGSESGLFILDMEIREAANLRKMKYNPYSISDNAIYSLAKDNEGGIWAGTYFRGINYLAKDFNPFEKYFDQGQPGNIKGDIVREIHEDQRGNLWVGTEDAGLNKFNPETGLFTNFTADGRPGSISSTNIHGLMVDGDKLWIGHFDQGIDILDMASGKVIKRYKAGHHSDDLKTNFILCIYKTSDQKILIGTLLGVYEYKKSTDSFEFREDLASQSFVYCIKEDHEKTIWIGTLTKGLFYKTRDGRSGNYRSSENNENSLSSDAVTDIFEDSKNRIWISTRDNGFCELDRSTNSFTRYKARGNIVCKIQEDGQGKLWITTPKGLVYFEPDSRKIRFYSKLNGLSDDQFNYNSGYKNKNGKIYFGSANGMIAFTPEHFTKNEIEPPLYITGLQVLNKELEVGGVGASLNRSIICTDTIILPYDQSTFSIDFAALSYIAPEMNEYVYMLEGVDKHWILLKTYRKVFYTKVLPGKYTFRLKVNDWNDQWKEKEKVLTIIIQPPFWQTGWAYLVYGILLGLIILLVTRKMKNDNRRKLEKINNLKNQEIQDSKIEFFTSIAHEIRTPLTLIKGPLDRLIRMEECPVSVKENLSVMKKNTDRLIDLSNQLLDFRKTELEGLKLIFVKTNICEILEETYSRFYQTTQNQGLDFVLQMDQKEFSAILDKEALVKVLSNLFTNALKFAENKIDVYLETENMRDGLFRIRVNNDGNIIPYEMKDKIFEPFFQYGGSVPRSFSKGTGVGLYLARSLVNLHKGELYLDKQVPEVNSFVVELPVNQDHFIELKKEYLPVFRHSKEEVIHNDWNIKTDVRPVILIVEDEEEMLDYVANELSAHYRILKSSSGRKALRMLEENVVNLIVSDIAMPGMSGFELCRILKSDTEQCHIPIVLLSAKYNLQTQIQGLEAGADACLGKPFSAEHLIVQISNLLQNRISIKEVLSKSPLVFTNMEGLSKADENFLKALNDVIFSKLSDTELSVDSLADSMNISTSSLYRKIKSICNMNPNEFIRANRLRKAAELLLTAELSVKEVAYLTGFSTPSYFSASFQKQYGMRPSDFVKKQKQDK